jgi:hypothetical protein
MLRKLLLGVFAALSIAAAAGPALAAQGDCCQPVTNGSGPTASDCLFILKTAVGSETCDPTCICSPDGNGNVTASDALLCLKKAVGQGVTLTCSCDGTTTTSTTTTTLGAPGATITIVNGDGSNEGFNDKSSRSPVGGNNGTTLGKQRLNVFEAAANIWEQEIASSVEIKVFARFDEQFCNEFGAVLGSAGAAQVFRDFPGALRGSTWFPAALANKLRGVDLDPSTADINATFNSAVGTTCPFPNVWYYGLDGNPPLGDIDLLSVVLHELGHGLGFATIVSLATGAKGNGTGFDDVFMLKLEDHSKNENYPSMTDGERVTASVDTGDLHYEGAAVVAGSGFLSAGRHSPSGHVRMYAPNPAQQGSSVSHFDTVLSPNQIMEPAYVEPNHDIGLMRELFDDIGWDGDLSP